LSVKKEGFFQQSRLLAGHVAKDKNTFQCNKMPKCTSIYKNNQVNGVEN